MTQLDVLAHSPPPLLMLMDSAILSSTDALKYQMVGTMTPITSPVHLTNRHFKVLTTHGTMFVLIAHATQLNVSTRRFLMWTLLRFFNAVRLPSGKRKLNAHADHNTSSPLRDANNALRTVLHALMLTPALAVLKLSLWELKPLANAIAWMEPAINKHFKTEDAKFGKHVVQDSTIQATIFAKPAQLTVLLALTVLVSALLAS